MLKTAGLFSCSTCFAIPVKKPLFSKRVPTTRLKPIKMTFKELNTPAVASTDKKTAIIFSELKALLAELDTKDLKSHVTEFINKCIEEINAYTGPKMNRFTVQKQSAILKLIEKEHKIVPKNRYRNIWGLFGITSIGIPIGVAFGISMGNLGLLGLGFPIGLAIGYVIGTRMDKKALDEGRQLKTEIKNFI